MLSGVLVTSDLVASSDFRARVGAETPLALEVYCRHRVQVGDHEPAGADRGPDGEFVLTGVAVAVDPSCPLGGWVLEVDGIPFYVVESSAGRGAGVVPGVNDRLPGSDPEKPVPEQGARVRVRGSVSVADGYVAHDIGQALGRDIERLWRVRRIARLPRHGRGEPQQVPEISYPGGHHDYLLDLAAPPDAAQLGRF
ncbi:hypothetical protein Acy02nite_57720 [Actinoplanes cyaneus]|uniref:Uncharacterized protein n=1 Tax=Actinoplanes cyaneus TaxID=52696 RepID=A0A919IMR1_9ACTN|nr:hypothetical protein [Actinoplanes cyaneus]MCW2139820.1 hypothetical protein [Actinoplanes cyaneus]GID67891.1 hypothetical protein Acy02nite_57720 [Actinoplanes cyaneus]